MYSKAQYHLDKAHRYVLEAELHSALSAGDKASAAIYMDRISDIDNRIVAADNYFRIEPFIKLVA